MSPFFFEGLDGRTKDPLRRRKIPPFRLLVVVEFDLACGLELEEWAGLLGGSGCLGEDSLASTFNGGMVFDERGRALQLIKRQ